MPHTIEMNMSLFVHILLDAEGQGLWKVQGNNFVNTVGYFNQYLAQLPKNTDGHPDIPGLQSEKLCVLSAALLDLARHDEVQRSTLTTKIDDLITQTTTEVLQLNADTDYLLPGGWRNRNGGHAMIYQFRKISATDDSPEKYRFSIYNSGDGLDEHEKQSTIMHEAYFPVKIYEIPTDNLNSNQFKTFIHHLIIPQFVMYEDPETGYPREPYDAQKLYHNIQGIMPFLNDTIETAQKAQLVSVSTVFPEHFNTLTTPGQISGTCSQLALYEMLKVNFDDTDDTTNSRHSQRCFFNFKLYALKDFIHQPSEINPQKRSPGIIKQIELGIIHLLTLLQEPGVFDHNEQAAFHHELNQLHQKIKTLVREPRVISPEEERLEEKIEANLKFYQENGLLKNDEEKEAQRIELRASNIKRKLKKEAETKRDASNELYVCTQVEADTFSIKANSAISALALQDALPSFNHSENILDDIHTLLVRCQACTISNPPDLMWIIDQIDQVINRLPIPSHDQGFQDGIDPYQNLNAGQLKKMEETLLDLQALYAKTMAEKAGKGIYPNLHITQCSFLALHDYCSTQYAKKTFQEFPYRYVKRVFSSYFKGIYHSVHTATNHPVFDQRLADLKKYYLDLQVYDLELMQLYQDILDTEPACKMALEQWYKKNPVSDAKFHAALKEKEKEALYYLFKSLDEEGNILLSLPLKKDKTTDFSSLILKIQSAIRMEKALDQTFTPLMPNPIQSSSQLRITFNNNVNKLEWHSHSNNTVQRESRDLSFYSHKYNLHDSSTREALLSNDSNYNYLIVTEQKKQSANDIQLKSIQRKTATSPLNSDDYFDNRLRHLRLSPESQILFTLNDFIAKIEKLSDFEHQRYVEANLFEPGLLNDVLKKEDFAKIPNPFLTRFDELIQNGLDVYNDNAKNVTPTSLFFVRLACGFNRYLLDYGVAYENPALIAIAKTRLTNDLALINEQIFVHAKRLSDNTDSASILSSLHHYRFLTLMSLSFNESSQFQKQLEQSLESYFYCQANKNTINPDDKATILERQRVERVFLHDLQRMDKTLLEEITKKIACKNLNIPAEELIHFDLVGTYPHYTLAHSSHATEYTVNIEQGLVYKNTRANIPMPLDLQSHPLLKRLGLLDATACYTSPDGLTLEFDPIGLRIRKEYDESRRSSFVTTIQKKWTVNGEEEWYDLQAPSEKHKSEIFNSTHYVTYTNIASLSSLPHSLKDGESDYWVNIKSPHISFIAKNEKRLYESVLPVGFNKNCIIERNLNFKRVASEEYYLNKGSDYHAILSRLESSKDNTSSYEILPPSNFLEVTLAKYPEDKGIAYLPRYGLSFELQNQRITLANTHYSLNIADVALNNSPFKPEIAQLILQSKKNQLCIVPVQRFYFDEEQQIDGERNRLTHDISNHIAHHQLANGPWKNINKKYYPQWYYANSAESIQFPIIGGKPKPSNAADALYLCYLYLGSNESDKAWAVLEDIRTRLPLEGHYREVTYLSWIINALPVMLKGTHDDARLGSPRDVACQLKALALYTDFLAQGKKPAFPDESQFDTTTANGEYEKMCFDQVKTFHDNLPNTVYQQYSKFLKVRDDHLSEDYALHDAECKSLLHHYQHSIPEELDPEISTIRGALGYEYRRLSLKILVTEQGRIKAFLDAQKARGSILSKDVQKLQKRYTSIQQEIDEQCDVMKCETRLEVCSIDLSLKQIDMDKMENASEYHLFCRRTILNSEDIALLSEKTLSSSITKDIFVEHIKSYFFIAIKGPSHKNYTELRLFLVNCLLEHEQKKEHYSPMLFLVKILYRLMHLEPRPQVNWLTHNTVNTIQQGLRDGIYNADPKALKIRQAKDVFEAPLKESREIAAELLEKMPTLKIPRFAMNNVAASLFKGTVSEANIASLQEVLKKALRDNNFKVFCENYILAENAYQDTLNQLKGKLKTLESQNIDSDEKLRLEAEIEQLAGNAQFDCIEKQRALSEAALGSLATRNSLRVAAVAEKDRINLLLGLSEKEAKVTNTTNPLENTLWTKIITLANSILIKNTLKLDSKKSRLLSKDDLLKIYFDDDLALMLEKTGLNENDCQKLRQDIHQCLLLEVQRQQATRLIKALDDALPNAIQLDTIASIFMSENLPDAANDPIMMLLQYESEDRDGILLRPRQLEALKNLFETSPDDPHAFNEAVERVIMGGGKSKVLLPLLAQKKASGLNLVIIEVPQALLATNHMDLNATSQKLFNQKAHRFEFNRDSDCSAKRLREIYELFLDIKTDRDYLVTTGESMQSLQLKYIEILRTPMPVAFNKSSKDYATHKQWVEAAEQANNAYDEWEKQVEWASKLAELLKDHGDVIIDEVHDGLLFKKKMNYTVGLPEALEPVVIDHTLALYKFVHLLTQKNTINPEAIKNQWLEISQNKQQLIHDFLHHPSSPLKILAEQLVLSLHTEYTREVIISELTAYLMEKREPAFLLTADPTIQDAFAFYKEQCRLLPQTLDRRYKENYGPSNDDKKNALEQTLAIPYAANDKPNERSRFGNALEILNYSTQALLIEGLNAHLLVKLIEDWQIQARDELQKKPGHGTLDNTPIAKKIIEKISHPDFTSLISIEIKRTQQGDVKITPQIEALLKQVHHHPYFLFTLLQNHALPQITTEGAILHSDAINHVSMYHSVQAVSGTPDNHRTFGRLKYNKQPSLGTRGYIQQILKKKNTPIHGADFTDVKSYLENLYATTQKKTSTHAIMDICATFRGKSNLEVAQAIAESSFCKATDDSTHKIKFVLYIKTIKVNNQESDVLFAYDIKNKKSIRLNNSNPQEINETLDCKPEERFSYYDQIHTTGIDLKQPLQSNGLCLVDEKTKEFFQGAYRMRGLAEQQTVEIIVPTKMANTTIDYLMKTMANNEENALKEDNFYATLAKLNNVIREQALSYIARVSHNDARTKKTLEGHFERYFIEKKSLSLREQYGRIYHEEDTDKLFEQHVNKLMADWNNCLKELNQSQLHDEIIQIDNKQMIDSMNEITQESLPLCHKKALSPQRNNGQEVELQQEAQKEQEQHKEQEKQKEEQAECYGANLEEFSYIPWTSENIHFNVNTRELNEVCTLLALDAQKEAIPEEPITFFSKNLQVSDNYAHVFQEQQHFMGPLTKPIHAILFRQTTDSPGSEPIITACIISNQECDEITQLFKANPVEGMWIGTTRHDVLAGKRPDTIDINQNQRYSELIEQIQFIDGQCKALSKQKTPLSWLSHDTKTKLDFLESKIIPYRETSQLAYQSLKNKLAQKQAALTYMNQNAANDLRQYNWQEKFPELAEVDIAMIQQQAIGNYQLNHATKNPNEQPAQNVCAHHLFRPTGISSKTISTTLLRECLENYKVDRSLCCSFYSIDSSVVRNLKKLLKAKEAEHSTTVTWDEFSNAAKKSLLKSSDNGKKIEVQRLVDAISSAFDAPKSEPYLAGSHKDRQQPTSY